MAHGLPGERRILSILSKPEAALSLGIFLAEGPLVFVALAAYQHGTGLDHPTRRRIYDHLLMLPGDHFRSIVRALRLGLGTTRHHLDVLIRHKLVMVRRQNGHVRYYPGGREAEPQRNRLYEKHWDFRGIRMRVLFAVRRMEDARPSTIARALGISRQLAAYHLARLEEDGIVRRSGGRYRETVRHR